MRDKIFYSASTGGFYHASVHGSSIPADAVQITALRHADLIEAQANGRTIIAKDGKPTLAPLRAPGLEELRARAVAAVKSEAGRRILGVASLEQQSNDNAAMALASLQNPVVRSPELMTIVARRHRIDAIRAASNQIEATIARMPAANLKDFDAGADRLWPVQE